MPIDNIKFRFLGTMIMFVHETIGIMKLCNYDTMMPHAREGLLATANRNLCTLQCVGTTVVYSNGWLCIQ